MLFYEGEIINRKFFYKVALLTFVWVILREDLSVATIISGIVISIICISYSWKFLPLRKMTQVNYLKLFLYFFYLIGQIYLSGFYVIKVILTGDAQAKIVEVDTTLTNDTLRVVLADSITLTPGSIMLDMTDAKITVLWLRNLNDTKQANNPGDSIKGHLEDKLLKMQI